MNTVNTVDLHTHTTFSDGTFTPSELIRKAADIGLKAIAITDHDTLEGLAEALAEAKNYPDLEVIAGTELSSLYKGREIHIVGLFLDTKSSILSSALTDLKQKRTERNIKMINKLKGLGLDVSMKELISVSGGKVITRAHFARLLQEKGYVRDKSEAFAKYIGAGKKGYVKRRVFTAPESISLIKKSGGLPIIAHPLLYGFGLDGLEAMVSDFAAWGAEAMECYYPTNSKEDTALSLSLCKTYGLLPSGGSDFHGENKPGLNLGCGYGDLAVPYEILENLKVKKYGKKIN